MVEAVAAEQPVPGLQVEEMVGHTSVLVGVMQLQIQEGVVVPHLLRGVTYPE